MANKFKLFVGFLALIALFSIYSFINSFSTSSSATKTANILQNSTSFKVDSDSDKDGLTNRDESYWNTDFNNPDTDGDGFLDGEEVSSGHDPLIPSPNDLLNTGNTTYKLSNLTLSGLYEGSLNPSNPNYNKSIRDMALAVMDDASGGLSSKISVGKLKTSGSSKESQEKYIKQISPIIEQMFSAYVFELNKIANDFNGRDLSNSDDQIIEFFKNQSEKYDEYLTSALKIAPPKNWESNHVGLLKLLEDLTNVHTAIFQNNADPITALVAMNRLSGLLEIIPKITVSYAEKVEVEKIKTESTIFHK